MEKIQDSRGVMVPIIPDQDVDLDAGDFKQVAGLSEFATPANCGQPLILTTPSSRYVLKGQDVVYHALNNGQKSIRCKVLVSEKDLDDIELALTKVSLRVAPVAGRISYPELVLATKQLQRMLLLANGSLEKYGWGGKRDKQDPECDLVKNVTDVLASRLDKHRKSINQYLAHSRHLSDEVLEQLVKMGATKKFFEKAQNRKTVHVNNLKAEKLADGEIEQCISGMILDWFKHYTTHKVIPSQKPLSPDKDTTHLDPVANPVAEALEEEGNQHPQRHKTHVPQDNVAEAVLSDEEYKRQAEELLKNSLRKLQAAESKERVKDVLTGLASECLYLSAT